MRVLVACEYSGTVRDAFIARGHDAMSCDLLPTDVKGPHYQGDVFDVIDEGWDLMIAHPPCTYLTNAGVRHLHENVTSKNGVRAKVYGNARMVEMRKAALFFHNLLHADIPKICVENPIPHKYAKVIIGQYSQIIQPWQFGHKETKATCLWLRGLPELKPTNIVGPPPKSKDMTPEEKRSWHRIHMTAPSKDRWKIRSTTYKGIAEAFANQWG
jgi:hypothetical protein